MINVSELINDHDFCQPNGISITKSINDITIKSFNTLVKEI